MTGPGFGRAPRPFGRARRQHDGVHAGREAAAAAAAGAEETMAEGPGTEPPGAHVATAQDVAPGGVLE